MRPLFDKLVPLVCGDWSDTDYSGDHPNNSEAKAGARTESNSTDVIYKTDIAPGDSHYRYSSVTLHTVVTPV